MSYYRLYFFNPRSHGIVHFIEIQAEDDVAAVAVARGEIGQFCLELWCGARRVATFDAIDVASHYLAARTAAVGQPSA